MARKENNTISQKNYDENNLKAIVAFNNSLEALLVNLLSNLCLV